MAAIISVQVVANDHTGPRPIVMPELSICHAVTAQATAATASTTATVTPAAAI